MDEPNDPKRPGYSWLEVDHHVVDNEIGVAALVDVRLRFIGKAGNVIDTPGVAFRLADARDLAATILEHAKAAELAAKAAAGDVEAAAIYDERRNRWDTDDALRRTYGN